MLKKNDTIYHIDLTDGIVQEGKFIEHESEGMWIRLNGQAANKFVFSDCVQSLIHENKALAQEALTNIRNNTKSGLSQKNSLIDDIIKRLSAHEGSFHTGIIKELLEEKLR
jgi:hypothetical protein